MPVDWRGRPQCGMTILQTAPVRDPSTGAIHWSGSVLDPRDGSVYRATLRLDNDHHLHLRGYLLLPILGETQVWTPFAGRTLANCQIVSE